MATRKKAAARDAVALLVTDHKEVAKLFATYGGARARKDLETKSGLVVKTSSTWWRPASSSLPASWNSSPPASAPACSSRRRSFLSHSRRHPASSNA